MDVVNSLLRAARSGNLKRVLEIVEDDLVDINVSNNNGLTALHSASKEGHTRIVDELLARGANVNARTLKGNQPIHIASLAGHEPVVRRLLDHGADVNAQSTSGFTSLYMAAQENHESIVKLLLDRGADQNISTTDGFTPLAVSLQQNHENIAKILLNHEARGQVRFPGVTDTGRSLLHVAAKKNDCAAAALLLQNNISPDVTSKSNFTSLHVACHYGNEAVAKLLIDNGADANFQAKQNITPLHVAARWDQLAMVNLLLDHNARIDAQTKDHLTPLHCAARMGHDACVELLIKRGAPISAKTRSHLVPLHMSAQGNHLKSAQILLNNRAPVDDVTIDHLTSLHVASHCGHVKVAKLLLDYDADPNLRAQNGFTSLHIACKKNHLEIVKLLLKYGASLKAVTESGLSCLHIASFMGCVEIVVYLLEHNADIEAQTIRGETPLILATRSNQFEVIDVLLRYGANANAYDQNHQNALHLSARLGNEKIAKLLIDRGIDIDAPTRQMYTALHIAAKENHEKVVALLLENDANISCATKNHEFFPLHLASKYGNDKIVELLLNYGAPVDARGKNDVTSLMVASHYDHPRVVELLLMFGASPHATAKNGYTAMHIAAKGNRIDCSNILLQNGADPNVESKAGFCPLHLASQEGRANMAALLLDNGAHVNCRAKNGITPLHLCAQEDHVNVAQLLVKYGAHLDSQTRNGFTPLHVACHFTRIRMIRFLLANGANVNVPAASGYTSLHQASQQGNPQIVDLLLQYNAKPDALTDNGHSALSIAENLGHVSVIDTLKIVTETVIKTTKTTITEEKFKIIAPETMQETFVSDSEDEADDTPAHQESVKFLTTDVMRSFNNTMAEDNYNTSQSNLNADMQQLQQAQRQRSQQSSEHLASVPRTTRIADEMSQDLQYLSREAPLDGGESTFGAYSTLGGPQQAPSTTVVRESAYKSTVTTTTRTTTPLGSGDGDALLLDDEDVNQNRLQNDYERTDFRIDGDDDATQVYDYDQRLSGRNTQSPFEDPQQHQQQLEQLAPDNVDIQRPLQQAGSTEPTNFTTLPYTNLADDETAVRQQEELAEVSRVEIERADLDNAREGVDDEPIRMVDLPPESGRTMPSDAEAVSKTELDHHQQQERQPQQQQQRTEQTQQNLQVANSLPLKPFLVSFMVDARGGAMRGCRHSGVRVIIPPNTAPQPMRITCRYLRRERLVHPPPLMEGEACASKIMEVGPAGARFLGPVLIEVPHFASLRGKEREIIILRSDSGEVWREHLFDQDEHLVDSIIRSAELVEQQQNDNQENQRPSSAIGQASQKDGGGGDSNQQQQEKRLTRIVTNEFPQYFAIISRIRQEVHTVGPDGLTVDSQVVPRVQAVFTDGALTKRIKIGLQKKNGNSGSPLGSPEPRLRSSTDEQLAESGQDRAKSPSGGRPGSAQAKRKSRFLACFGASHGSHDLLNQSGTDAEGFASGSNESSSSAGGDSPRQLASERLVERRHIIEDLTDSEADSSSLQGDKASKKKKRSATSRELVPDDYYIEQEPAFILNTRPKTYGKRLASSSSQTDQKLQANGYLSTSTKSQKRHGVSLLSAAKRRRNKTQMQIPSHEPTAQKEQQSSQSRLRPKSADLGTSTADSSLESHHADDNLDHLMRSSLEDPFLQAEEDDDEHQKWRNCTIQTDSDSVTVQYVTISSLADPGAAAAAAAAATATKTTTTATGQDDGYVSGSGELKRQAADQTASKTGHKGLFLPFCTSSGAAEDDDVADKTADSLSEERDGKRDRKRKKAAAKEKKSKKASGGSGKSSPTKLDVVLEANVDQQPVADVKVESDKLIETSQAADSLPAAPEADRSEAQLSAGEEADESLITSTRSISPSSKERKQQLKLEKQERLKKEKLERQKQKELDEANAKAAKAQKELEEANAKAAKAQKKLEKEAKKKAEKAEKLSKKASKQSPSGSRAQSPESAAAVAVTSDDESKLSQKPVGVLGAITKTIQSVKFAPSPSKDSVNEGKANESSQDQTHIDNLANEQAQVDSGGDSSMVHVSIGSDSALLGDQDQQHDDSNVDQLISFSSDTETIPAVQDIAKLPSSADQTKALKPILKQQSISFEEPQVSAAEIKTEEPKTLSSIADELISEATEEAVQAADAIQQARLSSETSSPTLTSAASDSKKEAAKKVKAEKDRLKAELKSSLDEEKRLKKEAKRLAKQAEEAAKKALHEAQEAREEAERQAEIAKKEAEQVLKLVASQAVDERPAEPLDEPSTASDLVDTAASLTKKTTKQAEAEAKKLAKAAEEEAKRAAKESEAEAKKQAKEAKAEAERLAKEAKAEAERLAKEAKAEAERLAKEEKARLKAEKKAKKSKSKLGVEPSAPSIDLVSSAEESQSSSAKEQSQASPVDDSKSVPIGLPRVSFELKRDNLEVKQENQEKSAGDGQNLADIAEAQDESGPIKTETVTPEELPVEEAPVVSKTSKKIKKEKKRKGSKKDGDTSSIVSTSSSKAESSAAETVSKSSFLGRLFKSKPKQKQQKNDSVVTDPASDPSSEAAEASKKAEEQQQVIVSEMYPSDPNNADGEMILEVNVPQDLISEPRTRSQQAESVYSPEEKVSAVTSVITSTTGQQAAEPTDDQEATLVNLSQMKDDVNDFEDDDEATENVLSQANDFVESQADPPSQSQIESVVHVHDQSLHEPQQIVDDDQAIQLAAMEVEANTQKILLVRDDSLAAQDNLLPQEPEISSKAIGAVDQMQEGTVVEPTQAGPSSVGLDLAKDEKAKKELDAKLEKEAKKQAKIDEKLRKQQEKADKKRAEIEAKKQAKEEKLRLKREAKEAEKLAKLAKKEAQQAKKEAKKNKKKDKSGKPEEIAAVAATSASLAQEASASDGQQQQPTTITTTTITSSTTTTGDDNALNRELGAEADAARLLISSTSEMPVNEETEVEQIVEEVVGEDGTVTKTTKTIETKYVTMRQEEVRVAERRDMPLEEWERMQAERLEQAGPSTLDATIERVKRQASVEDYVPTPELQEIQATPSYFDRTQTLPEIKPDTSEKKALKKRIKLNQRLIKRAYKLAKSESKKAKKDQHRAEAEIAVCDEAARQARKELKRAVKEAKRAAKLTEKQHKKMDKIDKKLAKRAKELEKRQKKIDKRLAKAAKKRAKKEAKAAAKEAKLQRAGSNSSSSKSSTRGSKRSIKAEDIGAPVLRSSSRLSIVQNNPNVELSPRQEQFAEAGLERESLPNTAQAASSDLQVDMSLEDSAPLQATGDLSQEQIEKLVRDGEHEVVYTITRDIAVEHGDDGLPPEHSRETQILTGPEAEAAAMRLELEAAREEEELIDVVGDGEPDTDRPTPEASPTEEQPEKENVKANGESPTTPSGKKKNKRKNKKQKSKESAE